MTFLDTIERIQRQPRPVRARILAASVGIIMGIVAAVWFVNLKATLSRSPDDATLDESIRPFALLADLVKDGARDIRSAFETITR